MVDKFEKIQLHANDMSRIKKINKKEKKKKKMLAGDIYLAMRRIYKRKKKWWNKNKIYLFAFI